MYRRNTGESFTMSGHVQSEVNNEQCKSRVNMVDHGSEGIKYNLIKMEIKQEPELSQMETYVDHLNCEESQYKQDMQEAVLEKMLDIESQGLMDNEEVKYEVLDESIDIEEHELVYKEDGQHKESECAEYLKLMDSADGVSAEKCNQTQPEDIEHGSTLTPGEKNILINTQLTINTIKYTAYKSNTSVNSDNDCTDTDVDVDNGDSTHWKMSIYNDVVKNKSSGEIFRQQEKPSRTGVVNKQTETDRRDTRHECEICQLQFNCASQLKIHLRTHTEERLLECEICKVRFKHKSSLKTHLRTHTGEKPYECDICQQKFNQAGHLKSHLRTHTEEKPFECEICQVRFKRNNNLKIHLRTHTGEKPFECDICQQKFNQVGHLKTHLRTHTEEKPFECEICQVRFNQKFSLKRHLRIHTGEKPFVCEICQVRFNQKGSLNTHLRTHTGEKPFGCEICQVRFKHKASLKAHLRTHTGEKPSKDICQ